MTRILLGGLQRAKVTLSAVCVADPSEVALAPLKASGFASVFAATDLQLAAAQDVVLLAVHPTVLAKIKP